MHKNISVVHICSLVLPLLSNANLKDQDKMAKLMFPFSHYHHEWLTLVIVHTTMCLWLPKGSTVAVRMQINTPLNPPSYIEQRRRLAS